MGKFLSSILMSGIVTKNKHSFVLDSLQMAKCLSLATEKKTVLLINEIGKATDTMHGIVIFESIFSGIAFI